MLFRSGIIKRCEGEIKMVIVEQKFNKYNHTSNMDAMEYAAGCCTCTTTSCTTSCAAVAES